jgi:hypothetical protein
VPPPDSTSSSTVQPVVPLAAPTLTAPATPTLVRYLRPFPVVRIAGAGLPGGEYIRLLRVTAPRTATVTVSCRGRGCPLRKLTLRPGRIKQFERFLRAGTAITIRVTRDGVIGKYVRVVVESAAAPKRTDACVMSRRSSPIRCPG